MKKKKATYYKLQILMSEFCKLLQILDLSRMPSSMLLPVTRRCSAAKETRATRQHSGGLPNCCLFSQTPAFISFQMLKKNIHLLAVSNSCLKISLSPRIRCQRIALHNGAPFRGKKQSINNSHKQLSTGRIINAQLRNYTKDKLKSTFHPDCLNYSFKIY